MHRDWPISWVSSLIIFIVIHENLQNNYSSGKLLHDCETNVTQLQKVLKQMTDSKTDMLLEVCMPDPLHSLPYMSEMLTKFIYCLLVIVFKN